MAHSTYQQDCLVPKGDIPGHWRLIIDFSFPRRARVNDGIEPEISSVHYTSEAVAC